MEYKIRSVDISKIYWRNILCGLQLECLPYDEIFPTHEGWWFVAFERKAGAVGFAGMVRSARWSDCMYLCRSGVKDDHRGHGLQKRLIRSRLNQARKMGMNWAVTETYENPPSANSLISCGFKLYEPSHPWAGDNCLYWRCQVSRAVQRPRKT